MALMFSNILENVDDPQEILRLCSVDKEHYNLCNDERFWYSSLRLRYGDVLTSSYKNQYLRLVSFENIIKGLMKLGVRHTMDIGSYKLRKELNRMIGKDLGNHVYIHNNEGTFEVNSVIYTQEQVHDIFLFALANNIKIYIDHELMHDELIDYYVDLYRRDVNQLINELKNQKIPGGSVKIQPFGGDLLYKLWKIIEDDPTDPFDFGVLQISYEDGKFTVVLYSMADEIDDVSYELDEDTVHNILMTALRYNCDIKDGSFHVYIES